MPKILFVLTHIHFIRNYITSGVLKELQNNLSVNILLTNETKKTIFDNESVVTIEEPNHLTKIVRSFIFDAFTIIEMPTNTAFALRYKRNKVLSLSKYFKQIRSLRHFSIKKLSVFIYGFILDINRLVCHWMNKNILKKYIKLLIHIDSTRKKNVEKLQKYSEHLIVIPSSAYSHYDIEIIQICANLNLKTLLLIDNWDNLTSKSILWHKPDFMAVWGEQTKMHAIKFQKMPQNRVFELGTPRFDQYFQTRDNKIATNFEFKYILFVGTFLEFNELEAITIINNTIDNNIEAFSSIKLVYRPHPWRQGKAVNHIANLKHVVLDPQIEESYLKGNKSFQPKLDYYPSLINNSEMIIGGLTSMIIEASIYNKNYIALAYDDGVSFISQKEAYESYIHFKGVDQLENVHMCHQKENLGDLLTQVFDHRFSKSIDLSSSLKQFIYNDDNNYSHRLIKLISQLQDN
jgi:hypothetical protein